MLITTLVFNLIALTVAGIPLERDATREADAGPQILGASCAGDTRIIDGDWQRNLFLNPRVSELEATVIIRAIRRREVVNKQAPLSEGPRAGIMPDMPDIDANQVTSISLESSGPAGRLYNVQTGCMEGKSYQVGIVDGKVELNLISFWIS